VEADRQGDGDGVASPAELRKLASVVQSQDAPTLEASHGDRLAAARALVDAGVPVTTLDSSLRKLPEPLRRLALELDGLWGNADGRVTAEEVGRVATTYLAALPFFTSDAQALLDLAHHLGLDGTPGRATARSVVDLRVALDRVDRQAVAEARPFRELFDQAVAQGEVAGVPELLRSAAAHSPKWHQLSILEHSAASVEAMRLLAGEAGLDWKDGGAAMLLHDVGKLLTRKVTGDGQTPRYAFWAHGTSGATWLEARGLSPELAFLVRHHDVLREYSSDQVVALCGGKAELVGKLVLVYLADQAAKGRTPDQVASLEAETPKILELSQRAGLDGPAMLRFVAAQRERVAPPA
jgi:hypothetical protein